MHEFCARRGARGMPGRRRDMAVRLNLRGGGPWRHMISRQPAAASRAAAGCLPLAFLTELRPALAGRRLLGGKASVAQIAAEVRYRSDSALSGTLHRPFGLRPGELGRSGVPSAKRPAAGSFLEAG